MAVLGGKVCILMAEHAVFAFLKGFLFPFKELEDLFSVWIERISGAY